MQVQVLLGLLLTINREGGSMNIRRITLIAMLFTMPLCIVVSQTHYLKGGKGKLVWTHDGRDIEGNLELDVNFVVVSRKTSNNIVVDLGV